MLQGYIKRLINTEIQFPFCESKTRTEFMLVSESLQMFVQALLLPQNSETATEVLFSLSAELSVFILNPFLPISGPHT